MAYRFPENKNLKKIKHGKIFGIFFGKIKILIFNSRFFSFWKIHAHKFFLKTSSPKSWNSENKIKIFIISKKFLKKFPCFIFFKYFYFRNRSPPRSKSTLYCWVCSHSRLLIFVAEDRRWKISNESLFSNQFGPAGMAMGSSSGGWLQAHPGVYLKRKGRPLNIPSVWMGKGE